MTSRTAEQVAPPALARCTDEALALLACLDRPIWIYDLEQHGIVWANEAGLQIWNAADLASLNQRSFDPTAPGTHERFLNLRHRLARGGSVDEHWTVYPLGRPCELHCRLTGVQLADGSLAMMVEAQPIGSDHPVDSYELRAVEAVRQAPLMISLATTTGHWLMHNPAAEALLNRIGHHNVPAVDNFLALFVDQAAAATLRTEALAAGSAQATLRIAGLRLRMHTVMVRRLNDPVTGQLSLIVSQVDVTKAFLLDRRIHKALDRERRAADLQRQFLLMTSHDFRTPLSIIDGAARRIDKLAVEVPAIADRGRTIRKAVRRMVESVDNTLATAMIAEGKTAFHPDIRDLRPILQHAVAAQRALHPQRAINLDLPHLSQLLLDPVLVEQIFENVLSNAIKYSPADGVIDVRGQLQARSIVIRVIDHGIGIPADEMPLLFTRYFRSRNVGAVKGTGVGLHAVDYFMKLHGGDIALDSREGQGTTVTLTFPLPE